MRFGRRLGACLATTVFAYGLAWIVGEAGMGRLLFSLWKFGMSFGLASGFAMAAGRWKLCA